MPKRQNSNDYIGYRTANADSPGGNYLRQTSQVSLGSSGGLNGAAAAALRKSPSLEDPITDQLKRGSAGKDRFRSSMNEINKVASHKRNNTLSMMGKAELETILDGKIGLDDMPYGQKSMAKVRPDRD